MYLLFKSTFEADAPAAILTNLALNLDEENQQMIRKTAKDWKNGDQGAATAMVAAFDPNLSGNEIEIEKIDQKNIANERDRTQRKRDISV